VADCCSKGSRRRVTGARARVRVRVPAAAPRRQSRPRPRVARALDGRAGASAARAGPRRRPGRWRQHASQQGGVHLSLSLFGLSFSASQA
jgi:hypothetical protein